MKVALYNVTTTTQFGGLESFVWDLAARLPSCGVQVDVLGGHGHFSRPLPPGARLVTFPYISRTFLRRVPLLRRSTTAVKLLERLSFGITSLPALLRGRYDVIHIQKPYDLPVAALARRLTGARLLLGCHGTDFFTGDTLFARQADGAVSCSHFNAAQVAEHYHFWPVVVFNGFDPARFQRLPPDESLRARFAGPSDNLLLFAGRLIHWKGIHVLLDAVARLDPSTKLVVAGGGEESAKLQAQAERLQIRDRVFFLGRVPDEELPRLYRISDLVVLPSLDHETFSIVACEALACARPVVGTRVGGIPELVEELVPPGDVEALAERIRALLADPARRAELTERGFARVYPMLTWEAVARRVVDVYERLVRGERVFQPAPPSGPQQIRTGVSAHFWTRL